MTFIDWDSSQSWDTGAYWDQETEITPYSSQYYLSLLTSEYNQQPNAVDTVLISVQPFADSILFLQGLPAYFELATAVGDQLTKLGNLIGVARYVETPITGVYFALDSSTLGLDQGSMQGEFDPTEGLTEIPDDIYRMLVEVQIKLNRWNGTIPALYTALNPLLSGLVIQDFGNNTMFYGLTQTQSNPVINQLFLDGYFSLAPAGVQVLPPAISSPSGTPFFGLDAENSAIAGLDVGYMI
jgi:hypothetical protein